MRGHWVIIACAAAIVLTARAYCADYIFPSGTAIAVTRTPDQLYLVPNTDIEVQSTVTNNTGAALRGISYTEHIPSIFDIETLGVSIDGAPVLNYVYEVSSDDIYSHTDAHRWILEEPGRYAEMDNPLPAGSTVTFSYRINTTGYYFYEWPPYLVVCEQELPLSEYCFGYCDETLLINEDTDVDGMADVYEIHFFSDLSHDGTADGDGDNLTDFEEYQVGTDPGNADTDSDGLDDDDEVTVYETNPLLEDTDGDELNDGEEVNTFTTSPLLVDTDSDGLSDYEEAITYGTDPVNDDEDDDGISDYEEVYYNGNADYNPYDPATNPGGTDTDAKEADTDGDGFSDYIENNSSSGPIDENDTPTSVRVNFQPATSLCPEGFCDSTPDLSIGRGYGWL